MRLERHGIGLGLGLGLGLGFGFGLGLSLGLGLAYDRCKTHQQLVWKFEVMRIV